MSRMHVSFLLNISILLVIPFTLSWAYESSTTVVEDNDMYEITRTVTYTDNEEASKNSVSLKGKLQTAEERVRTLVSKLDAVSVDASRAKKEIHDTLTEAWNIVDLLGRDKCGEAVERVRVKQKEGDTRISELERELAVKRKELDDLRSVVDSLRVELMRSKEETQKEIVARQQVEEQIPSLKQKYEYAISLNNGTEIFLQLTAKYQSVIALLTDRTEVLKKVIATLSEALRGNEHIEASVQELNNAIRASNADFINAVSFIRTGSISYTKSDTILERKLQQALEDREKAIKTSERLYSNVEQLKSALSKSGKNVEIIQHTEGGSDSNVFSSGTLLLLLISLATGALLAIFGSQWFRSDVPDSTPYGTSSTPMQSPYKQSYQTPGMDNKARQTPYFRGDPNQNFDNQDDAAGPSRLAQIPANDRNPYFSGNMRTSPDSKFLQYVGSPTS